MPGLVPGIHALRRESKDVDGQHKAGHDGNGHDGVTSVPQTRRSSPLLRRCGGAGISMLARMASACARVPVSPLKYGRLRVPRAPGLNAGGSLAVAPGRVSTERSREPATGLIRCWTESKACVAGSVMQDLYSRDSTMRWEQAIVYAVGALMLIGVAASVFQLYGAALLLGCILMIMSLADGPRGLKFLLRDVKRHVVGP